MAKELPEREQRALAGYPAGEPSGLLHAGAGARLARDRFGVEDDEVLRAITCHPTGSDHPSGLIQLLFVADFLEPTRRHRTDEDRRLLERALAGQVGARELFCRVLRRKLDWVLTERLPLHPASLAAWNAHCARSA